MSARAVVLARQLFVLIERLCHWIKAFVERRPPIWRLPVKKFEVLPRAMIAAERNALERFYEERRNRSATPVPHDSYQRPRRPDYGGSEEQITELLRCSIYPTTRAPDYVVDQLGYGEIVEEVRGDAGAFRSERHRISFVARKVRRTRSGMIIAREDDSADGSRQNDKAPGTQWQK